MCLKTKLTSILLVVNLTTIYAQQNTNRNFVIEANRIAKNFLATIVGKETVEKSVRLDSGKTVVLNDTVYRYTTLNDYHNDYPISLLKLVYNFRYQNESVFSIPIEVENSFKIRNNESYLAVEIPELIGWKQVADDSFHFNYNKLKQYIGQHPEIDTARKDIALGYKAQPFYLKQGNNYYIQTRFYWLITIYSKTKDASNFDFIQIKRELRIDTETGEVILDKALHQPFPFMNDPK